jgi:hypothetical protein
VIILCIMKTKPGLIVALAVMLVAAGAVFATDKKDAILIKGTVIGDDGKPCDGAEIKFLRVDHKGQEITVVSDGKGRYALYGLPAGSYTVTACYHGFERSRAQIKTVGASWANVNFDLRLDQGVGDGPDRLQRDIHAVAKDMLGHTHGGE